MTMKTGSPHLCRTSDRDGVGRAAGAPFPGLQSLRYRSILLIVNKLTSDISRPARAASDVFLFLFHHFCLKHHDGIRIAATEFSGSFGLAWDLSSVPENVDVGKGAVHGHGTDLAPVFVEIEDFPYMVAPVAAYLPSPVCYGDPDLRSASCHGFFLIPGSAGDPS